MNRRQVKKFLGGLLPKAPYTVKQLVVLRKTRSVWSCMRFSDIWANSFWRSKHVEILRSRWDLAHTDT